MDFNIYYLLIAVMVAFSVGCGCGLRVASLSVRLSKLQFSTVALAIGGYLATLLFLAREAEHASHNGIFPIVESAIIAFPFLIMATASVLVSTSKYQVPVFVLTAVLTVANTGVYYYIFEVSKDEYADLLLLVVVPVEYVVALIQLFAVFLNRKKFRAGSDASV